MEARAADDQTELMCPICMGLLQRPQLLPGCSMPHRFCGACIGLWLSAQAQRGLRRTCPIERRPLGADEQPVRDEQSELLLRSVMLPCPNSRHGCPLMIPAGSASTHAATSCAFRPSECRVCRVLVPVRSLGAHERRCHAVCADCGASVPRRDVGAHKLLWCLARMHGAWRTDAEAMAFRAARTACFEDALMRWQAAHVEACCDWLAIRSALEGVGTHMGLAGAGADEWVSALTAAAIELGEMQWRPALGLAFAEVRAAAPAARLAAPWVRSHLAISRSSPDWRQTTSLVHTLFLIALRKLWTSAMLRRTLPHVRTPLPVWPRLHSLGLRQLYNTWTLRLRSRRALCPSSQVALPRFSPSPRTVRSHRRPMRSRSARRRQ